MSRSIGEELRDARLARGLTAEQVSAVTKISARIVRAIEADDLQSVPGGVFIRGFLRMYAREVDLDPEDIVRRFRAQFDPPAPSAAIDSADEDPEPNDAASHSTDLGQLAAIALIVIAAAAYLGIHGTNDGAVVRPSPPRGDLAVATAGFAAAPRPVALESPELSIDLSARGPCWVEASADGVGRVHRLMDAGDRATVKAQHEVRLRAGDAAALAFSVNGAPGRPLGAPGRVVTVRITAENYRGFVAR
jgi:cytoskeleton protein RodZ